jgi:hypothetical protein
VLASLDGVEGVDEHPGVGVASSLLGSSLASSSTQGDLEDVSTITTLGVSFLPLGRISKSLPTLVLSSMNSTSLQLIIFLDCTHMNQYALVPSQYQRNKHFVLKIRGEMLNIREEIAHLKAHRSHKYVNNAWRQSSNSPPTLLFIPFPVPPH